MKYEFIKQERLSAVKLLSILCAFSGVVILSLGKNASAGTDRALGAVCCLAAAACYALYCVYNKKLDLDQNITMMIGWGTVAASMAYLTPFLSVIFSAIFLGESITLNALIALVVIISGVLALQL